MLYPLVDLPLLKQRACPVFIFTYDNKYLNGIIKSTIGGSIELYLPYNKITMYVEKYTITKIADKETDIRLPNGWYWQR
jgi:hypothetical protein